MVVDQFDNGTPSIARPVPENGGFHAEQCSALHKPTHYHRAIAWFDGEMFIWTWIGTHEQYNKF